MKKIYVIGIVMVLLAVSAFGIHMGSKALAESEYATLEAARETVMETAADSAMFTGEKLCKIINNQTRCIAPFTYTYDCGDGKITKTDTINLHPDQTLATDKSELKNAVENIVDYICPRTEVTYNERDLTGVKVTFGEVAIGP